MNSPRGYIDFSSDKILFLCAKNDLMKAEIGEVIEYFLYGYKKRK